LVSFAIASLSAALDSPSPEGNQREASRSKTQAIVDRLPLLFGQGP
jgi:hypothetical protein